MNRGQVIAGNFPQVLGMSFRDNQGVPFGDGIDVFKGKDPIVFIDLETGNLPLDYSTKNAIFHDTSSSPRII